MLTQVDFRVESNSYVNPCASGAVLGVSQTYDLEVPQYPEPKEVIPVRISQEVGPNEADRFALGVGVVTPSGAKPDPIVYQLGVFLYHDGKERPINAGQVLIAVPFPDDSYFDEARWKQTGLAPEQAHDCVSSDIATVRRALTFNGARSVDLTQLVQFLKE